MVSTVGVYFRDETRKAMDELVKELREMNRLKETELRMEYGHDRYLQARRTTKEAHLNECFNR